MTSEETTPLSLPVRESAPTPESGPTPNPVPTVCRMVHYMSRGSADGVFPPLSRAAVVTEVDPDDPRRVGLAVLNPTGIFLHALSAGGAVYGPAGDPGTWRYPPRA